jgi:hypothetical protein
MAPRVSASPLRKKPLYRYDNVRPSVGSSYGGIVQFVASGPARKSQTLCFTHSGLFLAQTTNPRREITVKEQVTEMHFTRVSRAESGETVANDVRCGQNAPSPHGNQTYEVPMVPQNALQPATTRRMLFTCLTGDP